MNETYKGIALGLPEKYDYMDSLSINGWQWEFLRRNEQYIEAFSMLEEQIKKGVDKNRCDETLSEIIKIASHFGVLIGRTSSLVSHENSRGFLILKIPRYEGIKAILNKYFGDKYHEVLIPKPETRYCDFIIMENAKGLFFFPQFPDYEIYESFEDLKDNLIIHPCSLENDELKILSPLDRTNNFFYIAVSKKADTAGLKKTLLNKIETILKKDNKSKPRIRQNKWKHYIIVYDLKQEFNDKISYDEIAEILIGAYPREENEYFYETRNINNWHEFATSLINGGFKKP